MLSKDHLLVPQGYKKEDKFIIAQNPMKSTANDFWKMIIDQEVPAIVMLGCPEEVSRVRVSENMAVLILCGPSLITMCTASAG